MSKGYWITCYRSVSDEAALAQYAGLAGPVIESHGGRFLARGNAVKAFEAGVDQRLVVIEFDSVERAIEAYESPEYQAALATLKDCAERDVRIVPGMD
jgi:uncharacterized protein (DUF1330 family)